MANGIRISRGDARFTVTDPRARRLAVQPGIAQIAARMLADLHAATPHFADYWVSFPGDDPGTVWIRNIYEKAWQIEYSRRGRPFMGPVVADYRARYGRH